MPSAPASLLIELKTAIDNFAAQTNLFESKNFELRAEAADFIDFHIIDRIDGSWLDVDKRLEALREEAEHLKMTFDEIDNTLFTELRQQVADTNTDPQRFIELVCNNVNLNIDANNRESKMGYDILDLFIDGLLFTCPLPESTAPLQPDMVFYQKTPARIVFEMAKRAKLRTNEVFFDIGSGLGQATILMNLITGANTVGIEFDEALYAYSLQCAQALQLSKVSFTHANALEFDYSSGDVFFLYTPFKYEMLKQMLQKLKAEAVKRTIRIFTYGPCSPVIGHEDWLACTNGLPDDIYRLYEFTSV